MHAEEKETTKGKRTAVPIHHASPYVRSLAERWWLFVLRGVTAMLFGVLALATPTIGLLALVFLWGSYALVDGVMNIVHALRRAHVGRTWGWLVFEGVVGVLAGVFTFAYPAMTALVLLMVIAAWAVVTGIAELAAAIRLRRHVQGEWLLAASGVLSLAFGALLFAKPGAGALALVWIIGLYAIAFGALLIGLGLRLHRWQRSKPMSQVPSSAAPSPA